MKGLMLILLWATFAGAQSERWVYQYNGPVSGDDKANAGIYGSDHSIYTAGRSWNYETGSDLTVVSLTTTGNQQWIYHYDRNSGGDEAYCLTYGLDGNCYVAGNSWGDLAVVSLTSTGDTNWTYFYNGPGNSNDEVSSIVYGTDGNIYVTGKTEITKGGYNIIAISLTPSGDERWVYQDSGLASYFVAAYAIIYGTDGNIYIAGSDWGDTTRYDFTIISLTAAGTERWIYRYNGPGNWWDGAQSIVYGSDGNLYASGWVADSTRSHDFTVISLTTAGSERWVYRYDGPDNSTDKAYSIIYGLDDNVYAAGYSTGNTTDADFTVISLTTAGSERWVYRYNGPANDDDVANCITYGLDGNIYAGGYGVGIDHDFLAISLTTTGSERWVYRYNGPGNKFDEASAIFCDSDGNIYLPGASFDCDLDFTVVSLTPAGSERWVYRYNRPGDRGDEANSLVYGDDNHIYAAGYSFDEGTHNDITVIGLNSAGAEQWVYRYGGTGSNDDEAYSIIYGSDGYIYAAGKSWKVGNDFTVISLTTAGLKRWDYKYNGPGNADDQAVSLTYGLDDNVYAAGWSWSYSTSYDYTVISLTSTGSERWVYKYDGPGNTLDQAYSIVSGSDGYLYSAGKSVGVNSGYDFTAISLKPDGSERWVYRYDGPKNDNDEAYSVTYGPDGNIYAAGRSTGVSNNYDLLVVSLTSTGSERWVYRYNGPGDGYDEATSIVYGDDGNIYVAGVSRDTTSDFIVVSLTTSGQERWVYRYQNPGSDRAEAITYGSDGNIYAAGKLFSGGTNYDLSVFSFNSSGDPNWLYRYNGAGNGEDIARSIIQGSDGNLYIAGKSTGLFTGSDFTVISLSTIGVDESSNLSPFSIRIYPNPFSDKLVILLNPTNTMEEKKIKIYDASGRLVRRLSNRTGRILWDGKDKGGKELPDGIYFLQFESGGYQRTKKVIKID